MSDETQDRTPEIEDTYPLSPLQQGLLFNSLLVPGSGVDVEQLLCDLHETLDVAAFQRAWRCVVARHPVLRTNLCWESIAEPRQEVHAEVELPWHEEDWRGSPRDEQDLSMRDYLSADRLRGFDLARAPLFRLGLLRFGDAHFHFILTFHHAVLEGRSYRLVLQEAFAFYEAFRSGVEINPPVPRPYRDYIDWLQQQDFSKDEAFWRETLKGFTTPTPLVVDHAPDIHHDGGPGHGTHEIQLSTQLTSALRALAQANKLNLNTIVQGVWALLLSRYSGEEDVVFGVVRSNRRFTIEGAEAMIGLFLNTLPLRVRVNADARLLPWLQEVRRQWMAMHGHEHTPLAKIHGWSEVARASPLFHSTMMFENYHLDTLLRQQGGAWSSRRFRLLLQTNFPLGLSAFDGTELRLRINFDRSRIGEAASSRTLGHLRVLLEAIVADPGQRIGELPLLTQAERHQLLVEWNDTAIDYPMDRCIHQLFEEQVTRTPEAVAVVFEGRQLTYAALNTRANQLAHHLISLGVGPEVPVGICVDRSLELTVGLLGILKAGGAYVPLDSGYPRERLAYMLNDTVSPVLITQQTLLAQLPRYEGRILCLDQDWEIIAAQPDANPQCHATGENLAYVIYTSGSTGRPKGVCIVHRGLVNYLSWAATAYKPAGGDGAPVHSSIAFDLTITGLFAPLLVGGRVDLLPEDPGAQGLANALLLSEAGYSLVKLTPAHLEVLAQLIPQEKAVARTRTFVIGGEQLLAENVSFWRNHAPDTVLINEYGPTETVVGCCTYTVKRDTPAGGAIPVGRPIANTQIYILNAHGEPVPVGVPGELYIGGTGLARGYLNRPELTAEKFVPDPFSAASGARMYRTGDTARYRPDGNIEFLGRIDLQVKIRGFRVELGEIETVLAEHAAVRQAVVIAREDAPGDKRVVAYVKLADAAFAGAEPLRAVLRERLPDYMVPSAFVFLDAFPLTPNGKLDRNALPPPDGTFAVADELQIAPRTPTESVLAGIWCEVLKLESVGIHDDFFELGGHSLLAAQVVSRLRYAFDMEFPLRLVFESPTVEHMAMWILSTSPKRAQMERRAELLLEVAALSESEVDALLAADTKFPDGD